mmetsp:Transcript_13832/g.25214  ORF Transcript_13832/g.25214 Transcript_13832/m.25214 type:complete len:147 (+) Transcript_13832:596-1036(+)
MQGGKGGRCATLPKAGPRVSRQVSMCGLGRDLGQGETSSSSEESRSRILSGPVRCAFSEADSRTPDEQNISAEYVLPACKPQFRMPFVVLCPSASTGSETATVYSIYTNRSDTQQVQACRRFGTEVITDLTPTKRGHIVSAFVAFI